jgi:uncharacterized membrane protein YtjA (UPF0391 family)
LVTLSVAPKLELIFAAGGRRTGRLQSSSCGASFEAVWNLQAAQRVFEATIKIGAVQSSPISGDANMGNLLHYALVFLVVALIAAAVGFGGVAGFAMEAARLLFWVFIVLFVISLVAGLVRRA